MAAAFVGAISGTATSGASITLDLTALTGGSRAAVQSGDLIIVANGWASAADQAPDVTTSGYTKLYDLYSNDSRDANLAVSIRVADGSETSVTTNTIASATTGSVATAYVLSGVGSPYSLLAPAPLTNSATGVNAALPNALQVTAFAASSTVVAIGLGTGDTTPTAFTDPTGYGSAVQVMAGGTVQSAILGIAIKTGVSPGTAEDPAAWTGGESTTSDSWCAATLLLAETGGAEGWIDTCEIAAVLGSGGVPGTVQVVEVATVLGAAATPGTIGNVEIATVLDASSPPPDVDALITLSGLIGSSDALVDVPREGPGAIIALSDLIGTTEVIAAPIAGARISLSDLVGESGLLMDVRSGTTVRLALSDLIGDVMAYAGAEATQALVSMSPLIGPAEMIVDRSRDVRISTSELVGTVRARVENWADEWTVAGLPCLSLDGFGVKTTPGLVRTQMMSGVVRQRRRWNGYRRVSASVVLDPEQLVAFEDFLLEVGGSWFRAPAAPCMRVGLPDGYEVKRLALAIVLDRSLSMKNEVAPGVTRLDVQALAISRALSQLIPALDSGATLVDLRVTAFAGASEIVHWEKRGISSTDIQDVFDWITETGVALLGGSNFARAVEGLPAYFNASADGAERVLLFLSDNGANGSDPQYEPPQAGVTISGITGLKSYAFAIDPIMADPWPGDPLLFPPGEWMLMMDNTPDDGVPILSFEDQSAVDAALESALTPYALPEDATQPMRFVAGNPVSMEPLGPWYHRARFQVELQ